MKAQRIIKMPTQKGIGIGITVRSIEKTQMNFLRFFIMKLYFSYYKTRERQNKRQMETALPPMS